MRSYSTLCFVYFCVHQETILKNDAFLIPCCIDTVENKQYKAGCLVTQPVALFDKLLVNKVGANIEETLSCRSCHSKPRWQTSDRARTSRSSCRPPPSRSTSHPRWWTRTPWARSKPPPERYLLGRGVIPRFIETLGGSFSASQREGGCILSLFAIVLIVS